MSRPPMFGKGPLGTRQSALQGSALGDEIDLRQEFETFIFGGNGKIPHGHPFLIRRMRRDSEGTPIPCTCKADQLVVEASPGCPYCDGEGYLWDEDWTVGYSSHSGSLSGLSRREIWYRPGSISANYKIFYLLWNSDIKHEDKIVEVLLDEEGKPVVPYVRTLIYKPQTIHQMRSDRGRLEFFTVHCREEDAIRSKSKV